ncbi:MAG: AAA family ATPase [Pseudomonadota bacterium]|nr:hypothetical protein [Gammaproteobacteria bacterium]MEC8009830.1 AAA family ATPase [Pseudomonadota bacterium]HBF09498.1 hypothetical protein [Gammaproteobacteria bacterium]|tara:strand:- start:3829 stop:5502 length:1674 start_codon:yes stop_codon:yes gene_type:complete
MKAEQPLESESEPQSQHDDSIEQVSINGFSSGSRHQFFEGGDRGQILDILPLLQMEGKNCVVIEGDTGMGKTILAQQIFIQSQNSGFATIRVDAHDLSSTDQQELYKHFGSYFKMSNDEIATLDSGEALAHRAAAHVQSQIVMIIDEAHALSAEAIAILVEFLKATPKSKVQVVFLAQPSSPVLMADFELQDYLGECGHQITLRQFNSRETSDYVRFLLIASEREGVKLSPQLQGKIYQVSEGVPAKIIHALEDALNEQAQAPVEEGKQRSEIVPKWHLVSLSLVAAGVIALIVFGNPEKKTDSGRFSDSVRGAPEQVEDYSSAPQLSFEDQKAQQSYNAEYGSRYNQDRYQGSSQSADDRQVEQPRFRGTEDYSNSTANEANRVSSSDMQGSQYGRNYQEASEVQNDYRSNAREAAPEPKVVERTPVQQPEPQPAQPSKVSMADQLAMLKAEKSTPSASRTQASTGESSWIKAMPNSHFTLQLLGGANKEAVQKFIRDNGHMHKMGYVETSRQGQPWYVVVYGDYASRAQASAAVGNLPSKLASAKPWIRSAADFK